MKRKEINIFELIKDNKPLYKRTELKFCGFTIYKKEIETTFVKES